VKIDDPCGLTALRVQNGRASVRIRRISGPVLLATNSPFPDDGRWAGQMRRCSPMANPCGAGIIRRSDDRPETHAPELHHP